MSRSLRSGLLSVAMAAAIVWRRARARWRALAGVPLCFAGMASSGDARANGRMAAAHQLIASPSDPSLLAMETTFGILVSQDQGKALGWVCESAVGYGADGSQDPSIALTTKLLLAGLREGLAVSPDRGCSWSIALDEPVVDLVVRPDDPHTAYALTSKYAAVGDGGGNLFTTHVFVTHDDGLTWTPQGAALDPAVQVETIDIARSDPTRIYVGGAGQHTTDDGGIEPVGIVLASRDSGATYTETAIPLDASNFELEGAAYVSAVDPTNPDRVYVRIGDGFVDRLLVSDDGAATLRTAFQAKGPLLGFALSDDGSRLYVGGPLDGVVFAPVPPADKGPLASSAFEQKGIFNITCLSWIRGELYACMGEPAHTYVQQLGMSTNDGASFAQVFPLACLTGPLACLNPAAAALCNLSLGVVHAGLGVCADGGAGDDGGADATDGRAGSSPAPDGTIDDASASAGGSDERADGSAPTALPSPRAGCRCEAGEAESAGGISATIALAALALRRTRRR